MKKIILLACISAAFFTACSKKDTASTPGSGNTTSSTSSSTTGSTTSSNTPYCQLTEIVSSDSTKYTISYDSKNRLSNYVIHIPNSNSVNGQIEYNASGQLTKSTLSNTTAYNIFKYTGDKITLVTGYSGSSINSYTRIHYNSKGEPDSLNYYDHRMTPATLTYITYDANGNATRVDQYDCSRIFTGYSLYEYDNKKNTYSGMNFNYVEFRSGFDTWGPNNSTKQTDYDAAGNKTNTRPTTYTYNSNNYPATIATTVTGPVCTVSVIDAFTYNCH